MRNYNNSNSKNQIYLIGFIIISVISVIILIFGRKMLENSEDQSPADNNNVSVSETSGTTDTDPQTATSDVPQKTSGQQSGINFKSSQILRGIEGTVYKNRSEEEKVFKTLLSPLAAENETIDSVVFHFKSVNGISLGNIQLGFGISVDDTCPDATDDHWYQDKDIYTMYSGDSSASFEWKIPESIKRYISVKTGEVLFGYWWGDDDGVVLESLTCNKNTDTTILKDGKKNQYLDYNVTFDPEDTTSGLFVMPFSDFLKEESVPEHIYIHLGSDEGSLDKIEYSIKIDSDSSDNILDNQIIDTQNNNADINWLLPEEAKKSYNPQGNIYLQIKSANAKSYYIDQLYIEYSNK